MAKTVTVPGFSRIDLHKDCSRRVRNDLQFRPGIAHANNEVEYDVAPSHGFPSRRAALTQCEACIIDFPWRLNPCQQFT